MNDKDKIFALNITGQIIVTTRDIPTNIEDHLIAIIKVNLLNAYSDRVFFSLDELTIRLQEVYYRPDSIIGQPAYYNDESQLILSDGERVLKVLDDE